MENDIYKEIDELRQENTVGVIKTFRIRRLGHIERINEKRMSEMILNANTGSIGYGRGSTQPREDNWIAT